LPLCATFIIIHGENREVKPENEDAFMFFLQIFPFRDMLGNNWDNIMGAKKMEFDLPKISHEFGNLLTLVVGAYQVIGSRHPELGSEDYWDTMGADLNSMRNLLGTLRGITPELTAQSSGEHQKNFASVKQERYDPVIAAHGKTICQV
jgi:hypothetical protein